MVLAHGPSSDTLRSCRMLRSMAADTTAITVVAGTEPGLVAIGRVRQRGFATVDAHGPDAVADALAAVDDDAVVAVIHDDVEVDAHGLDRMVQLHHEVGQVVVPHPQPDGVDQAVAYAHTAVLVGRGEQLRALADRGAFGPGLDLAGSFHAAGQTGMTHRGTCRTRLAMPAPGRERPLLVAAMIVRDEEANIAACLDALAPVVDRIEIADTGSVDGTVEIALGAGANVMAIDWRDDFAWARNQVLERCRDAQYVLWIDADERFRCANPIRLRQSLHTFADHFPSLRLRIADVDEHDELVADMWAQRIFRPDDVHFVGALHEQVTRFDGGELVHAPSEDAFIAHLGYQKGAVAAQDKFERNLRLARQAFQDDPSDERRAHLYRSLARTGQSRAQAESTLAEMDDLITDFSPYSVAAQAMMLTLRGNVCLAFDALEDARDTAARAVELVPADRGAVAVLVEALVRLGDHEAARVVAEAATDGSPEPLIRHNLPAEEGIAWALLRSALAQNQPDAALAHVGDVGDRDPWPRLLDHDGLDIVRAATAAARTSDRRFVDALVERVASSEVLAAAVEAFEAAGGPTDLVGPLRRAIRRAQVVESAPGLREEFTNAPTPVAAAAYARARADGNPDLGAELLAAESLEPDALAVSTALGIAAEASARRGDADTAVADAILALEFHIGTSRAAMVAASAAAASGAADMALDIIAAVRSGIADDDPRIHELANVAVLARLALEDIDGALGEAAGIVQSGGELTTWPDLIEATAGDLEQFTPVLGLALTSDGGAFIEATRHTLPAERAALTCLSYLAAGGTHPDAVTTGVITAAVNGRPEIVELILEHRDLVEPEALDDVAGVLRGGGHSRVADLVGTDV